MSSSGEIRLLLFSCRVCTIVRSGTNNGVLAAEVWLRGVLEGRHDSKCTTLQSQ
jgi:hypothetical protein